MRGIVLAGAAACSSPAAAPVDAPAPPDAPERICSYGDPSAPLQVELVHYDGTGRPIVTPPSAELTLVSPPQGIGEIVSIGARVTNVDGCHVTLIASFHDVCSAAPLKIDSRPATLEDAGGGWGAIPWFGASALQVCTSPTAKRVTQGQPFVFTVAVTDARNRHATASVTATPVCPNNNADCICQCHPDFDFGGSCPPGPDPVPPC